MTALLIFIVLFGAVLAFWFASRGHKATSGPRRWLVSKTKNGKVYADPWVTPPLLRLRTVHDEARRERVPADAPDIFGEIQWFWVPDEYCNEVGRFPVPWRGGVIYTTGWTVRAQHKTALSHGMTDETIKVEVWNNYGVFPEDDPLPPA